VREAREETGLDVELERLIAQGLTLIERRNAFEFARDHAAELFEVTTGTVWRPRAGSMVNHRALTASVIDSREFLAARRRADTELLAPAGSRIAFTGGTDCNDHARIWEALDKIRAKHLDIVLLPGGSPRAHEPELPRAELGGGRPLDRQHQFARSGEMRKRRTDVIRNDDAGTQNVGRRTHDELQALADDNGENRVAE